MCMLVGLGLSKTKPKEERLWSCLFLFWLFLGPHLLSIEFRPCSKGNEAKRLRMLMEEKSDSNIKFVHRLLTGTCETWELRGDLIPSSIEIWIQAQLSASKCPVISVSTKPHGSPCKQEPRWAILTVFQRYLQTAEVGYAFRLEATERHFTF